MPGIKGQYNKGKYPYEEFHKEIKGVLYKKCVHHHEFFPEEDPWIPCTSEYYYKNKHNKTDGFYPECKRCSSAKAMKWKIDNPEKDKENDARYRNKPSSKKNKSISNKKRKKLGKEKEWQQKNPEKVREYSLFRMLHKKHEITKTEWGNCKKYFDYRCAYCGLPLSQHYYTRNGITKLGDFHKEHVDHNGTNGLENCVPSCSSCNDQKWQFGFNEWYNENNEWYSKERYDKIIIWLTKDYKQYIEEKKPKRRYKKKNKSA